MKIAAIINSVDTLNILMGTKIKLSTSYALKKISDEVNILAEQVEAKRKELLPQFGTVNEEGDRYEFAEGKESEFVIAFNEYLDEDIDLPIKKIPMEALDSVEIEPGRVAMIEWILEI